MGKKDRMRVVVKHRDDEHTSQRGLDGIATTVKHSAGGQFVTHARAGYDSADASAHRQHRGSLYHRCRLS